MKIIIIQWITQYTNHTKLSFQRNKLNYKTYFTMCSFLINSLHKTAQQKKNTNKKISLNFSPLLNGFWLCVLSVMYFSICYICTQVPIQSFKIKGSVVMKFLILKVQLTLQWHLNHNKNNKNVNHCESIFWSNFNL